MILGFQNTSLVANCQNATEANTSPSNTCTPSASRRSRGDGRIAATRASRKPNGR